MGNSSIQIRALVDDACTFAEIAPVLPNGGYSDQPALSIANDTMTAMLAGSPNGEALNWKWNRILIPPFYINSWQQDYFLPGLVNLGWLEGCTAVYQNITTFPKIIVPIEVRRDVLEVSTQMSTSRVCKICWMQVDSMQCGVWGQSQMDGLTGCPNPGPGVVYTSPVGLTTTPINPITCVVDTLGNYWVVTQYGTCGITNPFQVQIPPNPNGYVASPVFPTLANQSVVATTVTDGTVIWTAINPKGQGMRINPAPAQTGPMWRILPVGQARITLFTKMSQYLDPVPDDYYTYFKQGFFAQCFRRSPDPKVRAKFEQEWALWLKSCDNAVKQGAREMDDWGFYPTAASVMDTGFGLNPVNPAYPFGGWGY
jgi:hypothetical protein